MLSFRSILLAATAFATISSAIPTAPLMHNIPGVPSAPSGDLDDLFGGLGSGGGIVADIGELLAGVSGSDIIQTSRAAPAGLPTKRGTTSVGDIFKICSDGVELIVAKIGQYLSSIILVFKLNDIADAAVNVEGGAKNVDHGLVKALLKEILVLLKVALKDLKVVAVAELTLNGVAKELAGVVAGLLIVSFFYILWLLLNVPFFLACYPCGSARPVNFRFH